MTTRTLHLVRHGAADPLGNLTGTGREQCRLLGQRLRDEPIDVIWHSPLPRAADSAAIIAQQLPPLLVDEATELVDHVPYVPQAASLTPRQAAFFDGYGPEESDAGRHLAASMTQRFLVPNDPGKRSTHEVLVTHAFQVAWMLREALAAPDERWLSLTSIANTALTRIELSVGDMPAIIQMNDQSHLPPELRWTGFPTRES